VTHTRSLHTATLCSALQHAATHCNTIVPGYVCDTLPHTRSLHTLQHTAARCSTLQHTAAHCNRLQASATALHLTLAATLLMHASHSYVSCFPTLVLFYCVQENLEIFMKSNFVGLFCRYVGIFGGCIGLFCRAFLWIWSGSFADI